MTIEKLIECRDARRKVNHLRFRENEKLEPMQDTEILICSSTGCHSCGTDKIIAKLKEYAKKYKVESKVKITKIGCFGLCAMGPIVTFKPTDIFYTKVTEADAERIIKEHVVEGKILEDKVYINEDGTRAETISKFHFYSRQKFVARKDLRLISPDRIEDYIALDGYFALAKAFSMKPEEIIEEIENSGLRGRGGAGFPTGKKWRTAFSINSDQKYVICNGDEGDPGAFMDRTILESNPHSIIEAMAIAGRAIGANKGVIYVRAEYKLAGEKLENAIIEARGKGLLGENILGSGFNFDIELSFGAGAFVCGEETALIKSVEGSRGEPVSKPPYPAVSGLYGAPTIINNVETLTLVPTIILNGAEEFRKIGTETSPGTKIFALSGKIRNTGLIEVPIGETIDTIVNKIGGGVPNGKRLKAVQIGGPSGGCVPADKLDLVVDYESLKEVGTMMGSGGMIVLDEDTCMVDFAKFFIEFSQGESCGKCVPCRIGNKRMHEILTKITEGNGTIEDLDELESLAFHIKNSSLCGLGQSAPNPVLSTLKYFRHEYEEHIVNKKCSAGVCKKLLNYAISDKCIGCGLCKRGCPTHAIEGDIRTQHKIDQKLCVKCGLCYSRCPVKAISKKG